MCSLGTFGKTEESSMIEDISRTLVLNVCEWDLWYDPEEMSMDGIPGMLLPTLI